MKIAYFTDTFLPKIDGVVTSLLAVSNALVDEGHEILIIAPKPSHSSKNVRLGLKKGITVKYIASIPSFLYPDLRAGVPVSHNVIQTLRKFNPDVIHFQTTFLIGGGAILLGKILHKPIIGSFHTYFMEPEYIRNIGISDQRNVIRSFLWRYAQVFYNVCDAVVTPAEIVREDLMKHGVTKPITVIPNSLNESLIKKTSLKQKSYLRKKYHLKDSIVLYVGRLSREKNVDELIQAFAKVVLKNPHVTLLIVGDGPAKDKLEKQVKDLNLEDSIVFTGSIKHIDLLANGLFEVADIFASASTSEVQPVSFIEAMAYGLPIVGVAKRGVHEMVKDVGLLSEPHTPSEITNNILKILNDRKLQSDLSKKSLKKFEGTYRAVPIAQKYKAFYEHCLKIDNILSSDF